MIKKKGCVAANFDITKAVDGNKVVRQFRGSEKVIL